jgi:hypothetical protein
MNKMLRDMEKRGTIEQLDSPLSLPVVLVRKENGNLHFCADYRKMNDYSKED